MIGGSTISKREANKFCDHVPPTIISNYDHLPTLRDFTNTKVNQSKPVFEGRGGFPHVSTKDYSIIIYGDVVISWCRDVISNYPGIKLYLLSLNGFAGSIRTDGKVEHPHSFCMVSMMWAPEFREKSILRCFLLTTVMCTCVDQWRRQKLRASHFMAGPSYHATHFSWLVVIHHQ